VEEKASAVRKAEEGASDLKKRFEELSSSLEGYENDYQVYMFILCVIFH
jgi:structural maintenance of chromosome 2